MVLLRTSKPTPHERFIPHLRVIHSSVVPHPILPVGSYGWFAVVKLPDTVEHLPLTELFARVRLAVVLRGFYRFSSPFGSVIGYELCVSPVLSFCLNEFGQFASWGLVGRSLQVPKKTKSNMPKNKKSESLSLFVIGHAADEFISLVPLIEGDMADDQNLEAAMKFSRLDDAIAARNEHGSGSVFEVVDTGPPALLRELMVDLHKVNAVPFDRCYRIGDQLLVGPCFVGSSGPETRDRVEALQAAGVDAVITLLDPRELGWMRRDLSTFNFEALFTFNYFPVTDGQAPSRDQMKVILDRLDTLLTKGQTVYLHCIGGRGRSGTVAACLLARHGIATGVKALNKLAEIRYEHGLFTRSPETPTQRRMVESWKVGE